MGKVLVIDVAKCNGCYNCQLACKDEHVGNDWSPYAKPQPETGHFWMKLEEMERGNGPFTRVTYIPTMCAHCDNAPCMNVCPQNAVYKRDDGIVMIDPEKCDGCASQGYKPLCTEACPYGAIYFNEELKITQKCTMCAHLLDNGWEKPRCVDACPTDAMIFGDESDPKIKELMEKAQTLHPEVDVEVKPRVLYLNLPKPFIAGTVYDPYLDECIEGAKITCMELETGKTYTAHTDEFGDFWIKNLEWGHSYSIKIEKEEYSPWQLDKVRTDKDVVLGDIPLLRKKSIT